jgi:hypothetical protein
MTTTCSLPPTTKTNQQPPNGQNPSRPNASPFAGLGGHQPPPSLLQDNHPPPLTAEFNQPPPALNSFFKQAASYSWFGQQKAPPPNASSSPFDNLPGAFASKASLLGKTPKNKS